MHSGDRPTSRGLAPSRDVEDVADLERSTERLAALVLGADALAERRRRPSRGTASVEREQRLARLQWAVSAGRAELQRLAATDDTAGAGGR